MTPEAVIDSVRTRHKAFVPIGGLQATQTGRHRIHFHPLTIDMRRVSLWFEEAGARTTMTGAVIEGGKETEWYAVFEVTR